MLILIIIITKCYDFYHNSPQFEEHSCTLERWQGVPMVWQFHLYLGYTSPCLPTPLQIYSRDVGASIPLEQMYIPIRKWKGSN